MLRPFPRRFLVACAATTVLCCTPTATAAVQPAGQPPNRVAADPTGPLIQPDEVISRASRILAGQRGEAPPQDATLALRDVFIARPSMNFLDGWRAQQLLARPTDGSGDPYGDGYSTSATARCAEQVCVHYAATGPDAPPNSAWVSTTLEVMNDVWDREIGEMGYRPPPTDGTQGGNAKFDVYLKELGSHGLFGYCAPEYRVDGQEFVASGYCVLDNDFAKSQYRRPATESLEVTAAHEFFHAIQFGYDFKEDPWLLESSATWMEEQIADSINDNRNYLKYGQLNRPGAPLDRFDATTLNQYGNWPFWSYLSGRFGPQIVKSVWKRAAAYKGAPNNYSIQALKGALRSKGGLTKVFAAYAAANTAPGRTYPEGGAWPVAERARPLVVGRVNESRTSVQVDHLASRTVTLRPGRALVGSKWRVSVRIAGPSGASDPAAYAIIRKRNGDLTRRAIRLSASGSGHATLPFSRANVKSVTLTLANVSTRYRCDQGAGYACGGASLDDGLSFEIAARTTKRS